MRLPRLSTKWLGFLLLFMAVVVLDRIPWTQQVTLQVHTKRMALTLPETASLCLTPDIENCEALIRNVPLTAMEMHGVFPVELPNVTAVQGSGTIVATVWKPRAFAGAA